ncbi:hypothetical protein, partial [Burkholderia gladioli]|uniref:hypothetical protein n=1 Tax=Burkholderia gladioli TaxID=28095 RepID=UPI001ABA41E3
TICSSVNRLFFMTSFLRWKPFSQVSTGPKITGQVSSAYKTHKTNASHKNAVDLIQYKNFPLLGTSFFVPNIIYATNIDPMAMKIIPIPKLISF